MDNNSTTAAQPLDLHILAAIADRVQARGLFNAACDIRDWIQEVHSAQARAARLDTAASDKQALLDEFEHAIGGFSGGVFDRIDAIIQKHRATLAPVAAQPAASASDEIRQCVRDAVAGALTGLYYCGRVWSAWSVGTMSEDDFSPADEDDDIIENVTDAAINAVGLAATVPAILPVAAQQAAPMGYISKDAMRELKAGRATITAISNVEIIGNNQPIYAAQQAAAKAPAAQADVLGYAIFREGKPAYIERSKQQAESWVDAEIVPLVAASPASTPEASQQGAPCDCCADIREAEAIHGDGSYSQQAAAVAAPIYQFSSLGEKNWSDCKKEFYDDCPKYKYHRRIVYTAPAGAATTSEGARDAARWNMFIEILVESGNASDAQHIAKLLDEVLAGKNAMLGVVAAMRATQQEGE